MNAKQIAVASAIVNEINNVLGTKAKRIVSLSSPKSGSVKRNFNYAGDASYAASVIKASIEGWSGADVKLDVKVSSEGKGITLTFSGN